MPLLAGKTDQRKTTPYLLLSHVQDLSRSPEIRQDPPTVTRVASVDQQPKHHGVPHASGPGHEQEGTWEQWQPDRWTPWCSPLDSAILACGGVSPAQNAVFYWEKLITRHGPASAFFFFLCVCVFCAGLHQHADCAKEKGNLIQQSLYLLQQFELLDGDSVSASAPCCLSGDDDDDGCWFSCRVTAHVSKQD